MVNDVPQVLQTKNWKDIYLAAILEVDPERVLFLIQEAERAIIERARESFKPSDAMMEEEKALDEALCALHALKSCLALHGRFAETAGQATDSKDNDP
jgi:hypothetical protein